MTVDDKIDRLEKQVNQCRRTTAVLALLLVAVVSMGQAESLNDQDIRCRSITVLDPKGLPSVVIKHFSEGEGLFDSQGAQIDLFALGERKITMSAEHGRVVDSGTIKFFAESDDVPTAKMGSSKMNGGGFLTAGSLDRSTTFRVNPFGVSTVGMGFHIYEKSESEENERVALMGTEKGGVIRINSKDGGPSASLVGMEGGGGLFLGGDPKNANVRVLSLGEDGSAAHFTNGKLFISDSGSSKATFLEAGRMDLDETKSGKQITNRITADGMSIYSGRPSEESARVTIGVGDDLGFIAVHQNGRPIFLK